MWHGSNELDSLNSPNLNLKWLNRALRAVWPVRNCQVYLNHALITKRPYGWGVYRGTVGDHEGAPLRVGCVPWHGGRPRGCAPTGQRREKKHTRRAVHPSTNLAVAASWPHLCANSPTSPLAYVSPRLRSPPPTFPPRLRANSPVSSSTIQPQSPPHHPPHPEADPPDLPIFAGNGRSCVW